MTQFNQWDCELLVSSIEAASTVCKRVCGKPDIPIIGVTNDQYNYSYGIQMGTDQRYPYITIMPSNVDDEDTSYNKFVLNNTGFTVSHNPDNDGYDVAKGESTIYKFQLVPIKVLLNIAYFTQSTKDVWEFIQRWKYNYRKATFNLVAGNNFNVDIRTELSPQIDCPEKNHESGDCYKITGTLTLHTYAGQIYERKTVERIDVRILTPEYLASLREINEKGVDNNFVLIKQFTLTEKQNGR